VQVLDHEHHRGVLAERVEQREQRLEDARLLGGLGVEGPAKARQERVESRPQRRRQRLEHRVAVADERAERAEQRCVGELTLAELDAVAPEHGGTALARPPDELVRQAGLAYPRLTGYQRERWPPVGRVA
jgi:hypothetical protein